MTHRSSMTFPREFPSPSPAPPIPIVYEDTEGMPLRAYAAIQLRVPDSGIDWLDRMIERARRFDRQPNARGKSR